MSILKNTNRLILGIIVIVVLIPAFIILFQKKNQSPSSKSTTPPIALRFDSNNENCVTPKDTPPKKLFHMALGLSDFYDKYNEMFIKKWKCVTGETVTIDQKYGVSGQIMRSMIKGDITPDVVTLSNPAEMDNVATLAGVISPTWRDNFPHQSSPYYSSVVFVVRKGNPLNIKDWGDLTKPGITLLMSNPKICGGGRWVYTAALGYAMGTTGPLSDESKSYMSKFYNNVPVLYDDQGQAGNVFVLKHVGDVLVTYEKFALLQKKDNKPVDIVIPSKTVSIDVPVAVAEKYAERDNVTDIARAYLNGLYDPTIQRLITQDLFHPRNTMLSGDLLSQFPTLNLFTRDDVFGVGKNMENAHLGDGGFFDSIK